MTENNGVWTWTSGQFSNVSNIEFKVRQNHSWTTSWGNSSGGNYQLSPESGKTYTLTVNFNGSSITSATLNEVVTAHTYTVGGTPTSVFGGSNAYDPTISANDMGLSGSNYTWSKDIIFPNASVAYKVYLDHSTTTSYPASANTVTGGTYGKVYNLAISYNPDNNNVSHTLAEATFTVAGNNDASGAFGANWDASYATNDMTFDSSTRKYTWTSPEFTHNGTDPEFKVTKNHSWDVSYPTDNYVINGGTNGNKYTITVTYDPSDNSVTAVLNQIQLDPAYYLTTANGNWTDRIAFTNNNGTFTLTQTFNGQFCIIDENGTWYGHSGSLLTLTRNNNSSAITANAGEGNNFNLADSREYTLTISNGTLTVTGWPAPEYYLMNNFSGNWVLNDATNTQMIESSGTYTWSHTFSSKTTGNYYFFVSDALASAADDWSGISSNRYGPASNNDLVTPSTTGTSTTASQNTNSFMLPAGLKGTYTFNYNPSNGALTVTGPAPIKDIYLHHWSDDFSNATTVAMTTADDINYSITLNLAKNEYLLFTDFNTNGWSDGNRYEPAGTNKVLAGTAENGTANANSADTGGTVFQANATAGNWTFTFNRNTLAWTAVQNTATYDTWYLKGDLTDWTVNSGTPMSTSDNITFTASVTINERTTEPKYMMLIDALGTGNNDGWDDVNANHRYGNGGNTVNPTPTGATTNITKTTDTDKNIVLPKGLKGTYTFSFNSSTNVLTITGPEALDVKDWYLLSEFDGNTWNITNANDHFTYNESSETYTLTKTINTTMAATHFILSTKVASGSDAWSELSGYRYNVGNSTDQEATIGTAMNLTQWNDGSWYLPMGYSGEYTFTINKAGTSLTITGPAKQDVWYLHGSFDNGNWHLDNAGDAMTKSGTTYTITKTLSAGTVWFNLFKNVIGTTYDDWSSVNSGRYSGDNSSTNDYRVNIGTAMPVVQNSNKSYVFDCPMAGDYTFTFDSSNMTLTVSGFDKNTGEMYLVGNVHGLTWTPNQGEKMTRVSDGVYTLEGIEMMSGADFSFTGKLGTSESDWETFNRYRYFAVSENTFEVTGDKIGQAGQNNATAISLQHTGDTSSEGKNNFKMKPSSTYKITVNTNEMWVKFERMYPTLYMIGVYKQGNSSFSWNPTQGIELVTTDGKNYVIDAVTFEENVDANGFIFSKVLAANNDDGGKQYVVKNGYVPSTSANYLIRRSSEQNDINKELDLVPGSTEDAAALTDFNEHRFYIYNGEAEGKYNVVVKVENGVAKTVKLRENLAIDNAIIVRLQKTANLDGKRPALRVYNSVDNNKTKYQGIWVDGEEKTTMGGDPIGDVNNISEGNPHLDGNMHVTCSTYTSPSDGKQWYEWRVEGDGFRIGDLHFYRNGDYSDTPDEGDLMRRAGVLYFTWVDRTIEDNTIDYYYDHITEAPSVATMIDGHYYVYFVNTPGWSTVYCHAWDTSGHDLLPDNGSPAWPGDICSIVGFTDDGFAVYRYDFGLASYWKNKNVAGIIFNSGIGEGGIVHEQSGDFEFKNGGVFDYVGRVTLGRSLGNIIANGVVDGPKYEIEDDLVIVYYNPNESGSYTVTITKEDGSTEDVTTNYQGVFYAKDLNAANKRSNNLTGKLDYIFGVTHFNTTKTWTDLNGKTYNVGDPVELLMEGRMGYDQSNWVRLVKANDYDDQNGNQDWDQLQSLVGTQRRLVRGDNLAGQLVDNFNPTIIVEDLPASSLSATTYKYNDYIAAHFNDSYSVNDRGDLFFVSPKANEVAHITWAVYGGDNCFYVPADWAGLSNANSSNGVFDHGNAYGLTGGFRVANWSWTGSEAPALEAGQAYQFNAVIRYRDGNDEIVHPSTPVIGRHTNGYVFDGNNVSVEYDDTYDVDNSQFIVYPVQFDASTAIVTGINDITPDNVVKAVKDVKIYNAMGVEQREMQNGVNIIVTTYTDGSRATVKVLR